MTDDNGSEEDSGSLIDWPRRNVLKLAGVGVAGLGGAMAATATEGESDDEKTDGGKGDEKDGKDGKKDDDEHFISDLVDPTFGYPLAADETDDLDLEYVVDVTLEEGTGAHPGFPTEDFGEPTGEGEGGEGEGTPAPETPTGMDVTPTGPSEIPVEFFFDPVGLWVKPCSPVHFKDIAATHTVTAYHEKFSEPGFEIPNRVPDGVPGFTSPPLTSGESWVYEFETPGVYDYFCFPHLGLGMVGRIVVFDPEKHDLDDERFTPPEAENLYPNDELVLTAPELDPKHIVEHERVSWSDLTLDGESSGGDTEGGTETSEPSTPDGTATTESGSGTETETETETGTGTETG